VIRKWQALLGVLLLAALVVALLPGCAPAAGEKHEWRLGQVMPEDSPYAKITDDFADEVRVKTDGRVDITCYHGGVLGDWVLMNELVMRGDVEMLLNPIAPTYDPRLNIAYYTPYLFTSIEEAKKAYATGGWINEMVGGLLEGVNIKGLAAFPAGMSGCTLRDVPPSPADPDVPKNQKIRVMPLKACELTFKRLGYIPVAIPYAEAYISIDTGIVDGEMGGPPFQGTEFMDIQGCWIQYSEYVETWWFALNLDEYNGLSEADQKVVVGAADKAASDYWLKVEADDEKYRQEMAANGLEIIVFSEAELKNIAKAIRTDVWPELESLVGKAVMDTCREHVGMPVK